MKKKFRNIVVAEQRFLYQVLKDDWIGEDSIPAIKILMEGQKSKEPFIEILFTNPNPALFEKNPFKSPCIPVIYNNKECNLNVYNPFFISQCIKYITENKSDINCDSFRILGGDIFSELGYQFKFDNIESKL